MSNRCLLRPLLYHQNHHKGRMFDHIPMMVLSSPALGRHNQEEVTRMRLTNLQSRVTLGFIALLLSGLALLLGLSPHAWAMQDNRTDGHVYVLNNDLGGPNSITVFNRQRNGSLSLLGA